MILSSSRRLPGKAIAHPTDDDLRKFRPIVTRKAVLSVSIIVLWLAILIAFISNRGNRFLAGYVAPLDLPLNLAGNFGEARSDHWHLGLDIRTNGKENLPVRSVADGWISRVTISANGYGNALYVTHDNNRTSLYAHLNSFSEPVADYVASIQRRKGQWTQDITIPEGKFEVEKGAIIGLSGNTGFSEGPHLHFEWRNTVTGTSINPLLEVAKVADDRAPVIKAVYWYSRDRGSDQYAAQKIYSDTDAGAKAGSSEKTLLVPSRTVSIGVTVLDKINSSPFNMGVYQVKLFMDGRSVHTFRMDSLPEANSKEVVRATDYAPRRNSPENRILLLSSPKKIPGTMRLSNGDGIINLADGKEHSMSIETKDIAGNTSTYSFTMKYPGSNYIGKPSRQISSMAQFLLL
ncbi:M23 family metallopeptidase [Flavitalea antarctica]